MDNGGYAHIAGATNGFLMPPFFPTTEGAFDRTPNNLDAFFTKLSPSGMSLAYSTLLGGNSQDFGNDVAIDPAGRACIVGITPNIGGGVGGSFPTTSGAFQTSAPGQSFGHGEAFLEIIDPAGNGTADLVYGTYLRGATGIANERADSVCVDASGNVYVSGVTGSSSFPTTPGAYDTSFNGNQDVFVVKLNPGGAGSQDLLFGTFLGSNNVSGGIDTDSAVDRAGNLLIVGDTEGGGFPITPDAIQPAPGAARDAFLTWLSSDGSALLYSSYLGGNGEDRAHGVAIHDSGEVVVVGETGSGNFLTANAVQPTRRGAGDAFVSRFAGFATNLEPTMLCPAPVTAECDSPSGTTITLDAVVTDGDGDALTVIWTVDGIDVQTDEVPAGEPTTDALLTLTHLFSLGTHTLELSVSDGVDMNECPGVQVVVTDTASPVLVCPIQLDAAAGAGCMGEAPDLTSLASANDDCTPAGSITITQAPASGTPVALGSHIITVTATDGSDNSSACDVVLEVIDQTPPVIHDLPTPVFITADADCNALVPVNCFTASETIGRFE